MTVSQDLPFIFSSMSTGLGPLSVSANCTLGFLPKEKRLTSCLVFNVVCKDTWLYAPQALPTQAQGRHSTSEVLWSSRGISYIVRCLVVLGDPRVTQSAYYDHI